MASWVVGRRLKFEVAAVMESSPLPASDLAFAIQDSSGLYLWQGNGVLLMGQRENETFVLARGWLEQDRLTHLRRWRFTTLEKFSGQVRRLVLEASGDHKASAHERMIALAALSGNEAI